MPGLSDYTVVVRGKSKIFLAGPPLLKAATGEIATDEELGGAELHYNTAGTAEYMAEDDAHGVETAREIVGHLPWQAPLEAEGGVQPFYDAEELLGIVPEDSKKPYDVREIIARVTDGSDFLILRRSLARRLFADMHGLMGRRLASWAITARLIRRAR